MNTKQYIDWLRKDGFHPEKKFKNSTKVSTKLKGLLI